jgi:hypothetical protein
VEGKNTTQHCLNCNRGETEIPLVSLRYTGSETWICSRCLPLLIHHPDELIGKLAGADKFGASPHSH